MFEPVKIGFGEFMGGYYAALSPTTKPLQEFVGRGLAKSIAFAPGRLVDKAAEMLGMWQRNDTDQSATRPAKLPAIIVGVAKDSIPTGRDFTRQIADSEHFVIPEDPKGRMFGLRLAAEDVRAQVVFFAADEPTARSLAKQFQLFLEVPANRRFQSAYSFAGFATRWPVQIETPEIALVNASDDEVKNVTVLAMDLVLKVTVPLFDAPKVGEPNDGLGTPGNVDDPAGYPVVIEVENNRKEPSA